MLKESVVTKVLSSAPSGQLRMVVASGNVSGAVLLGGGVPERPNMSVPFGLVCPLNGRLLYDRLTEQLHLRSRGSLVRRSTVTSRSALVGRNSLFDLLGPLQLIS